MKIYIIEDSEYRINWFKKTFDNAQIKWTNNVSQACKDIMNNEYDIIFLRDLGHSTKTGEDIIKNMVKNKLAQNAIIIIHTINIRGKEMKKKLEEYHKNVHYINFFNLRKMKKNDFKFENI